MSAEGICTVISLLVVLLNMIGTLLFSIGNINGRISMKRIGIVIIASATITAVLNLSWYLVHFSLFA